MALSNLHLAGHQRRPAESRGLCERARADREIHTSAPYLFSAMRAAFVTTSAEMTFAPGERRRASGPARAALGDLGGDDHLVGVHGGFPFTQGKWAYTVVKRDARPTRPHSACLLPTLQVPHVTPAC